MIAPIIIIIGCIAFPAIALTFAIDRMPKQNDRSSFLLLWCFASLLPSLAIAQLTFLNHFKWLIMVSP